jgi:Fe-S-cluster containining protein
VWITDEEIERMAAHLKMPVARFMRQHVRRVGNRLSLVELKNGDCVLLKDGKCSVYPVKPVPCSTFPFWEGPLASPEQWRETAKECEGIGQGPVYPRTDIERLLAGDPEPLVVRHATPAAAEPVPAPAPSSEPAPQVEPRWEEALAALEALYAEVEREIPRTKMTCVASGDCCDFDAFGHRLYASTLEAEWFFRHAPDPRVNSNPRHCPAWGADRLCRARVGRMLGCRTYHCGPYPGSRPEDLHEPFDRRIKALHDAYAIPYRYRDILDWARERRPVSG